MLLLDCLNVFLQLDEVVEVAVVVVDDFDLEGPFIDVVDIGTQLHLQGLQVGCRVVEVLHRHHISHRVHDIMILLHLLEQ